MSWRPLTLTAVLLLALSVPGVAAAGPPPEVEPRAGTQAPAQVSGLSEPAQSGDPVAAAKAHLAHPRYHLDPADLVPRRTVVDGRDETVRFAQRHRGLPAFGAQYLVRFRDNGGRREVVGAGGRFPTGLSVGTAPAVSKEMAETIARVRAPGDRLTRERATARAGWSWRHRHVLVGDITDPGAVPDMAGDRYVVSDSTPDGATPPAIITGRPHGGRTVTLSEGGRADHSPATDGRQAVWASADPAGGSRTCGSGTRAACRTPRLSSMTWPPAPRS
ncbi:hypothetical protein [Nonomuraea sp. NPDC050643]|uniref:hypothetical protein n=1 Tax=Nonomuraea sp. NPDC050643 TaxID=3155660 RepID=UPI0033DDD660